MDLEKKKRERHLETIYANGQWFQFPVGLLHLMSPNEAIVLAELMNESKVQGAHSTSGDGWFAYPVESMTLRIGFSPDAQYRAIRKLQDSNRIESEQREMPAKRHFRINFVGIDEELSYLTESRELVLKEPEEQDYANSRTLDNANLRSLTTTTKSSLITKSQLGVGTASSSSTAEEDQPHKADLGFLAEEISAATPSNFDMKCALVLNGGVIKNLKNDRRSEMGKWAHQFRLLRTKDGASKEQIKEVLQWYVLLDWGAEFVVQAFSGSSFRDKFFDKLIPAMKRQMKTQDSETFVKSSQQVEFPETDDEGMVKSQKILEEANYENEEVRWIGSESSVNRDDHG